MKRRRSRGPRRATLAQLYGRRKAWRAELDKGSGELAGMAPEIIASLDAEIAAREAGGENAD